VVRWMWKDGKVLHEGPNFIATVEACCCHTPPPGLCSACIIFYGSLESDAYPGLFGNNIFMPETEEIIATAVNVVVLDVAETKDLLSQALECHCTPQEYDCLLVCGDPDFPVLRSLKCETLVFGNTEPGGTFRFICGGVCYSDGSLPLDPGGKVDGDPCTYDNTDGAGSRPGVCVQEDSIINVADKCCKVFNKSWELTDVAGGCEWQTHTYNLCNFPDIHYDQYYHVVDTIQDCRIHGGDIYLAAWRSRNWYPETFSVVEPADTMFWWAILYIKANNMRHYVLYRSTAPLSYIYDAEGTRCANSSGIFEMKIQRTKIFNDVYPYDPWVVPTCDFPQYINLTAYYA